MENVSLLIKYAGDQTLEKHRVAVTPGGSYENPDDIVYDKVVEEINKNMFEEGTNGYIAVPCLDEKDNTYILFLLFRNISSISVAREG